MAKVSALKDPLGIDKETLKKAGIEVDPISPIRKLTFLQEQKAELETILWRSRVDVVHATRLTESDSDALRQKGHQNLAQHLNEVQQFWGGIKMIERMIEQIREDNPDLAEE